MRMLRVIGSLDPADGGPSEGLRLSTAALARLGCVTEVATVDEPGSAFLANCDFKVHAFGGRAKLWSFSPCLLTWLRAHASDYDVVIQHGLWNFTAFASGHAMRRSHTPYLVFTHGMLDPWFRENYPLKHALKQMLWLCSEGPLVNNARAVFFTSEEERHVSRNAFWPYRVTEQVVSYGTNAASGDADAQRGAFFEAMPALASRRYLLFLSRLHPKKGCDLLIKAFAKVAANHPDLDLVMAGPDSVGWRGDLQSLARKAGIAHRIHWAGLVRGDVKAGAFRACEAFVLPSHQENFGIVIAEALSYGRPVLTTNKVNIWREVETAGAGLVETDDQDGVDRLLRRFFKDADFRAHASAAALKLFAERFEIGRVAQSLLDTIVCLTRYRSCSSSRT
jgi:glycosyltransferase involved in cell wall biosynthesis